LGLGSNYHLNDDRENFFQFLFDLVFLQTTCELSYLRLDECLDENTLVTVLREGKIIKIPIKNLDEKNDLVKSFNEDTEEIQWMPFELFYKGEQECYELEFENGEKIVCTESHKWYLDDKDGKIIVVTTKDIIKKGYILSI
jgi:intein/homing endonuclease